MNDDKYNSANDTYKHIAQVRKYLAEMFDRLVNRMADHDKSKLEPPEKPMFDEFTPKLRNSTYGSSEYEQFLKDMGPALQHHYANNSHHPEHYENGIDGMSLIDLVEMLADWKAATMRHADGNIRDSLKINKERFGISDQLATILQNTVSEMDW